MSLYDGNVLLVLLTLTVLGTSPTTDPREISGRVVVDGRPVPDAVVEFVADPGELLNDVECPYRAEKGAWAFRCNSCPAALEKAIEILKAQRSALLPVSIVRTNAKGEFSATGLNDKPYAAWVRAPGSLAVIAEHLRPGRVGLELELRPGVAIEGIVLDLEGNPVANQPVMLVPEMSSRVIDTVTGTDGTFRVSPLPTGEYNAVVQRDGFVTEAETFDPTQKQKKLVLRLLRPVSLVVQVVGQGGKPEGGVEVELRSEHEVLRGRTEADGRFTFKGLRLGGYWARAKGKNQAAYALVAVTGAGTQFQLRLQRAAGIHIQVKDDMGSPVRGAAVSLLNDEDAFRENLFFLSGDHGQVDDEWLPPGKYFVTVKAHGFLERHNEKVQLSVGKTATMSLEIRRSAELAGTVLDSQGAPAFNAWVGAQPVKRLPSGAYVKDDSRPYTSENTGRAGDFKIGEALPGDYLLFVRGEGLVPFWQPTRAPAGGVQLRAPSGGVVLGKVVDAQGLPVEGVSVRIPHLKDTKVPALDPENADKSAKTSASGDFRIQGLSPGKHSVRATLYGLQEGDARCDPKEPSVEKIIEVGQGQQPRIRLQLPRYECLVH